MNTVKSDFVKSADAAATRVDLDPLVESDFSTQDPEGNQREPLNKFAYREFEYFMGPCQKENREASKPRDHAGVPQVQEVKEKDERTSKGGY